METLSITKHLLNKKKGVSLEQLKKQLNIESNQELLDLLMNVIMETVMELPRPIQPNHYHYVLVAFDYFNILEDTTLKFDYTDFLVFLEEATDHIERQILENQRDQENYSGKFNKFMGMVLERIRKAQSKISAESIDRGIPTDQEDAYHLMEYLIFEIRNYDFVIETFKKFPILFEIDALNNNHFLKALMDSYIEQLGFPDNLSNVMYFHKLLEFFITHPAMKITRQYRKKLVEKLTLQQSVIHDSLFAKEQAERLIFLLHQLIDKLNRADSFDSVDDINYKYGVIFDYHAPISPFQSKLHRGRKVEDFRKKYTFTIDTPQTRSFDDALSFEVLANGNYLVSLYISDVGSYVGYRSDLDNYAYHLGQNIYLPNTAISIFPHEYTYDICSLNQNSDHYVLAYQFEFTPRYEWLKEKTKIQNAYIHIDDNFDYEAIDTILERGKDVNQLSILKHLIQLAETLKDGNYAKEAYHAFKEAKRLEIEELVGEKECLYQDSIGGRIVQEMKILANHYIAEYFWQHQYPFLYRNNEVDEQERLFALMRMQAHHNPKLEDVIFYLENFYKPSSYSAVNKGHHGLGFPCYSHSLTPIRNYSAFTNQKLIQKFLIDRQFDDVDIENWGQILPSIADHLNEQIRVNKQYASEYMRLYRQKVKALDKIKK